MRILFSYFPFSCFPPAQTCLGYVFPAAIKGVRGRGGMSGVDNDEDRRKKRSAEDETPVPGTTGASEDKPFRVQVESYGWLASGTTGDTIRDCRHHHSRITDVGYLPRCVLNSAKDGAHCLSVSRPSVIRIKAKKSPSSLFFSWKESKSDRGDRWELGCRPEGAALPAATESCSKRTGRERPRRSCQEGPVPQEKSWHR